MKGIKTFPTCAWCDKPGAFLCDFRLGGGAEAEGPTCDNPMCEDHRHVVAAGRVKIASGKGKGCHPFSVDHCPFHAGGKGGAA